MSKEDGCVGDALDLVLGCSFFAQLRTFSILHSHMYSFWCGFATLRGKMHLVSMNGGTLKPLRNSQTLKHFF